MIRSFFSKLLKPGITKKFLISYLIVTFIPYTIGTYIIINAIYASAKREYLNMVANNLHQMNYNTSEKAIIGIQVGISYAMDKKLQNFLMASDMKNIDIVEFIRDHIQAGIASTIVQNPSIYRIQILHGNKAIFDYEKEIIFIPNINGSEWRNRLDKCKNLSSISESKYYKILMDPSHNEFENLYNTENVDYELVKNEATNTKDVYTFFFPIYTNAAKSYIGLVEVDMLNEKLMELLQKIQIMPDDLLMAYDNSALKVVYCSNPLEKLPLTADISKLKNYDRISIGHKPYYCIKEYNGYLDCWYVQLVSANSIIEWKDYRLTIIVGIIVSLLILCSISWIMSRGMLENLLKLSRAINNLKNGDFQTEVFIKSRDEIGELAVSFNEMAHRIRILLDDIKNANDAEKEAIYKALESQIRPHFLCNALDAVRMTAEIRSEKDIACSLETITNYFMYNLAEQNKYVNVDVELKNVSDYINIHNMIRMKKISLDIRVNGGGSENIYKQKLLKFTLQPIVENCIKHGFSDKVNNCCIFIKILKDKGKLILSVEDNGRGIAPDKLSLLLQRLNSNIEVYTEVNRSFGIGLINIKERLLINYGINADLSIESYEGTGTCIIISIPQN